MNIAFHEDLEGAGYRETWSAGETLTGGTLDEDATPGVTGWGAQALQLAVTTGPAFVRHVFSAATTPFYLRFEIAIVSESLADGQACRVFWIGHDAANTVAQFYAAQVAGAVNLYADVFYDGASHVIALATGLSLATKYRVEFKWDLTADTWQLWRDGTSISSGTISSTPATAPWEPTDLVAGAIASDNVAMTFQIDRVSVSREARVQTAPIAPPRAGDACRGVLRRGRAA